LIVFAIFRKTDWFNSIDDTDALEDHIKPYWTDYHNLSKD
jgi:hypothetical protein